MLENVTGTSINDGDKVVQVICQGVLEYLGSEWCSLYAVDPEKNELLVQCTVLQQHESEIPEELARKGSLVPKQGPKELPPGLWAVARDVVNRGATVNILDASKDERFSGGTGSPMGEIRSVLSVVINLEGKPVGVMQVANKLGTEGFLESEEEALSSLSMFAGITLANMRLYNFVVDANKKVRLLRPATAGPCGPRRGGGAQSRASARCCSRLPFGACQILRATEGGSERCEAS